MRPSGRRGGRLRAACELAGRRRRRENTRGALAAGGERRGAGRAKSLCNRCTLEIAGRTLHNCQAANKHPIGKGSEIGSACSDDEHQY